MGPLPPLSLSEIEPGELWLPETFEEWAAQERLRAFLPAWTAQADHERRLRERCAWMIFFLAIVQTLGGFGLLVALGMRLLNLDESLLKVVYSALLAEIFGLFFVVARYIFRGPLAFHLPEVSGATDGGRPAKRH